jgi:hypothetical protein
MAEGVELRLADLPARLAEQDVVIGVRIKRQVEIDKIDACVGKLSDPKAISNCRRNTADSLTVRDFSTSLEMTNGCNVTLLAEIEAVHCFTFLPDIGPSVQST